MVDHTRPDLDSHANIDEFVSRFYAQMLRDARLAPLFLDVAAIDLDVHLPHIRQYWYKLLLGDTDYRRHTMNIHRKLHGQRALGPADFERWLQLFTSTVDAGFAGPGAERAKRIAATIARNMASTLQRETEA